MLATGLEEVVVKTKFDVRVLIKLFALAAFEQTVFRRSGFHDGSAANGTCGMFCDGSHQPHYNVLVRRGCGTPIN